MPIHVFSRNDSVVIETPSGRLVLTKRQGLYLLKKLAELYGFRLNPVKPVVRWRMEAGGVVRVDVYEGSDVRSVLVPVEVLEVYCEVFRELGPGRYLKREIAARAMEKLVSRCGERVRADLSKYFSGSRFDWKRFSDSRADYYTYFRAPLLVFDALGVVRERRSPYIEIDESVSIARNPFCRE